MGNISNSKFLCDMENEECSLEVVECECGFHLGVDATYLDQEGGVEIICPVCKKTIIVKGYDEEENT